MLPRWNDITVSALLAGLVILTLAAMGLAEVSTEKAKTEITLIVLANAEVFFDGEPTVQKGTERVFVTPERVSMGSELVTSYIVKGCVQSIGSYCVQFGESYCRERHGGPQRHGGRSLQSAV